MIRPMTDEELRAKLAEMGVADSDIYGPISDEDIDAVIAFIKSYAKDYAENEKLGLIDKLNKDMFYSEANPSGQHIKNCLMAEYDAEQRERMQ